MCKRLQCASIARPYNSNLSPTILLCLRKEQPPRPRSSPSGYLRALIPWSTTELKSTFSCDRVPSRINFTSFSISASLVSFSGTSQVVKLANISHVRPSSADSHLHTSFDLPSTSARSAQGREDGFENGRGHWKSARATPTVACH